MGKENLLLIGNTGSGKSYLLNSVGGNFNSGFNAVHGLTEECDYCDVNVGNVTMRLIDVPGLLEATDEKIKRNADAITQALRMSGSFKLIFVLAECAGRVLPSDLFTIAKVLTAIDFSIDVGVIINKVPSEDLDLYNQHDTKENIIKQLNSVANNKINKSWFSIIPRFRRDDRYGATPYMTELLGNMKYQPIANVTEIRATIKEYNAFVKFLQKVGKAIIDLWEKFVYEYNLF